MKTHKVHLCDTCIYNYPECDSVEILFGRVMENNNDDNVLFCDAYMTNYGCEVKKCTDISGINTTITGEVGYTGVASVVNCGGNDDN